ncbi:predicted protein [Streptomyces viridochromogenes DSM 40736]|uniref:Predicted protein n=1 Tax=Streptomyces viridochromogenes (strain DSM 40736 / JCM 4977 / BCRC 1201 / Tue 494) TaxID=591159 RepID=D9X807_STRVT|nr:predicted protein [Streptomyces viridochromogenes DSM 40736]
MDGRRRSTKLRGEGVGLDYRPSPRQLRRSSPKRMMRSMLAEALRSAEVRISMRDRDAQTGQKVRHTTSPRRVKTLVPVFHQSWWRLVTALSRSARVPA